MNYFSKYVTKFRQGGAVDATMQLATDVVQHFDQLAQILPEEAQQMLMAKLQETAPKSKEEAITAVAQAIAETPELEQMLNAALQPQEPPQQYKNGGALAYIDCLRKPDCGCKRGEKGAKLQAMNSTLNKAAEKKPSDKKEPNNDGDWDPNAADGLNPNPPTPDQLAKFEKKKKTLVGKAVDVAKKLLPKRK